MITLLQFVIFLFFPAGVAFLFGWLVTSFGGTPSHSTKTWHNPFFYIWIIQAIIWTLLITFVH